jgi:tetratricopeptide (TPR) repeat protein/regulation of enolase protein 1 (concanavalin A-like superfamily)
MESLLRVENLPEKVKEAILRKAEGNPFFVEEVIRSLIDAGVVYKDGERWAAKGEIEAIALPDTIQSVIMARIDGLEEEVKHTLQSAAVIGRIFRHKLLQHIAQQQRNLDSYLWQLEEKDLIYEERAIPELEYSFKHVLIQETVHQSLLSRQRQALHQRVGEGIEELYQDRIEEFYGELAWHYLQSGHVSKAIDYLLKAGQKAKGMYANREAISYFEKALEFIQAQPTDEKRISLEMTICEELGDVLFTTGAHQEAEAQFYRALSLASNQPDMRRIASLTCKLADSIQWQGEYDRAIEIAESGLRTSGDQEPSPELANLLEVISRSYWAKGDWESARRYANQNAQIIRQIPYFDAIYKIYYSFAWLEINARNFQKAIDWLEEMERICIAHRNEVGLARCYHGLGDLWRHQRDFQQASQWLEKSLSYCERTGDAHLLLEGHLELSYCLILLDANPSQAEEHIQKGMEIADQMASTSQTQVASAPLLCRMLGDAYLQKGNLEQARLYFRRGIEFGPPLYLLPSLLSKVEQIYLQQGQHEAFFAFCQQMQQQTTLRLQTSLRYWHLQPGSPSADYSQLTWQDSFEDLSLQAEWRWTDPQGKSSYDFIGQKGVLELRTSAGCDLSAINLRAPRLLRQISGDFAVETKLVDITEEESQIGGLLLWLSEKSYLSFGKRSDRVNEVHLEVCQGNRYEIIGRGLLPGRQLYLRLERCGESVSALCSDDGNKWQSCGKTSFPLDNPVWIGLYVACPSGLSDSVVRFKEFKLFQSEEG